MKRYHCIDCGECIRGNNVTEAQARHDAQDIEFIDECGPLCEADDEIDVEDPCPECEGLTEQDGQARPVK